MLTKEEIFNFFKDKSNWEREVCLIEEGIFIDTYKKKLAVDLYVSIYFSFFENNEVVDKVEISHPFLTMYGDEIILNKSENILLFPRLFDLIDSTSLEIKIKIMENYLEVIYKFKKIYEPILNKYNFFPTFDGLLSFETASDYNPLRLYFSYSIKSQVSLCFEYSYLEETIFFSPANTSKGKSEEIDLFTVSKEKFESILRECFLNDSRTEYLVSDDPKLTENSWNIFLILREHILAYEKGRKPYNEAEARLIDINQIPKKWESLYYQYIYLKEEYEKNVKKDFK